MEKEKYIKGKFKKFLDEYVKYNYNFQAYVDDLFWQYDNTGILQYELSSSESYDDNPHLFHYTLEELEELGY